MASLLLVVLIGVVMIAVSFPVQRMEVKRGAALLRAEAEILRLESSAPGSDGTAVRPISTVFPVVRFKDGNNQVHEYRLRTGMVRKTVEPGDSIAVLYNKDDPRDVHPEKPPGVPFSKFLRLLGIAVLAVRILLFAI